MDTSIEAVRERLTETKGKWAAVASGSGVGYFTVCRIGRGAAKKPHYATIQKLAQYFTAQEQKS